MKRYNKSSLKKKIVFEKWHWYWYFKDKMILNGQNNIGIELYMSELVDLDLLHLFLHLTMAKLWPRSSEAQNDLDHDRSRSKSPKMVKTISEMNSPHPK